MSEFKWPAFISYRNHNRDNSDDRETDAEYRLNAFAGQLYDALTSALGTRIETSNASPFLDKKQKNLLATDHNKVFADAICYSACMIVIYTHTYFSRKKTYCTREYMYMADVEKHRNEVLDHDGTHKLHIIVTLDCDASAVPEVIRKNNIVIDDLRYIPTVENRQSMMGRKECEAPIRKIADKIRFLYADHQYNGEVPAFYTPFESTELEQDDAKVQAFLDTVIPKRSFSPQPRPRF